MKRAKVNSNVLNSSSKDLIENKIIYMKGIIQDTILSIKIHKNNNLFSENDITLSLSILIDLYEKINVCQEKNSSDVENMEQNINDLQTIIDKLSLVICGFGTKHVTDLLYVTFGNEFKTVKFDTGILQDKFCIIKKYLNPIGYKIVAWKAKRRCRSNSICTNKLGENTIDVENINNIECIYENDSEEGCSIDKLNHVSVIFHSEQQKKTIIINGVIDDMPLCCLTNKYIDYRLDELNDSLKAYSRNEKEIFKNIIGSLTLKDILIYSKEDIKKRIYGVLKDADCIKQTHIDVVVKKFLEKDLCGQRDFLMNLLLFKEDHDIQYACYILYDLINTIANENETETIGNTLYNSFPINIRQNFKNIVKTNVKQNQQLIQKYETNKISLEKQIHLLRVDDTIKEKAITKLQEMKGKSDDMTAKTKQYLEGLVKIPFETFYEEPIIKIMKENNDLFKTMRATYMHLFKTDIFVNKGKYTNSEISRYVDHAELESLNHVKTYIRNNIHNCTLKKINKIVNIANICIKLRCLRSISTAKKSKSELCKSIIESMDTQLDSHYIFKIYDEISNNKQSACGIISEYKLLKNKVNDINEGIKNMEMILDDSIHGHANAKKQIMKIIGQWMNGEKNGYSFGFEGSPGIGKTSLANKGLTKCLTNKNNESRPFHFIALGGSSNGSFLEGHSYTYMNSTWGKIVDILMDSKCMNPIIYIDELDKVSKTEQGREIIGILTHLIDPTQNTNFQDKYFSGITIDVSKVLFIFSYNDPDQIDKILLDRIHRIKFENLSIEEKITIVNKFILPEINKKMGFENIVDIDNKTIEYIIKSYTLEPGVRKLKEILFDLYGEINLQLLEADTVKETPVQVTMFNIDNEYLAKYSKINEKRIHGQPEVGIINGLWANSLGNGGITAIQTMFYPCSVFLELQLTGLQGDVMKESMNVAKSLAWNLTTDEIKEDWLTYFEKTKCQGLHIHCPEGAISKDGPSAGAAITTAIYSLLNSKKIKNDIAITGEITLNGSVTAIGGLDIKLSYGIKNGVKTFLFPKDNHREFKLWFDKNPPSDDLEFIEIENIKEIFKYVFL